LVADDDAAADDVFLHAWTDPGRTARAVTWWSRVLPVS
jgi:hypothetical protein